MSTTKKIVEELKRKTAKVVADKKFAKAMTTYVEEERRELLSVTLFDGKSYFSASPKVAKLMEENPTVLEKLVELFEKNLEVDNVEEEKPEIKENQKTILPLLFAPFQDKSRGWHRETVSEQVTLYFNILGYGYGGDKSLVTTKFKSSTKPAWFPSSVNFDEYIHPSHAKLKENEDVIESLLTHFGLDPRKHAKKGEIVQTKRASLNSSVMKDPVVIGAGLEKVVDKDDVDFETFVSAMPSNPAGSANLKRKSLEGGEKQAKKKAAQKTVVKPGAKIVPNPEEKSDYEKIRDQNIKERKEEEKNLGFFE